MRATVITAIANLKALKAASYAPAGDQTAELLTKTIQLLETALASRPVPQPPRVPGCTVLTPPPLGVTLTLLTGAHPLALPRPQGAPTEAWQLRGVVDGQAVVFAEASRPRPLLAYARSRNATVQCLFDLRELES